MRSSAMTTVPLHLSINVVIVFKGAVEAKYLLPTVCGSNPSLRNRSSTARTNFSCSAVAVLPTLRKIFFEVSTGWELAGFTQDAERMNVSMAIQIP